MERREFLALIGATTYWGTASHLFPRPQSRYAPPDFTLRIGPVAVEIAPRHVIKTIGYNGSFPGPLLRVREGEPVTIDVVNGTKDAALVHWHGLRIPSEVDGSEEEGTPPIGGKMTARYTLVPSPAGTRWYRSHIPAGRDLGKGTYSGQFGVLYVEPKADGGAYDAEVFLALHGWEGYMTQGGDEDGTLEVAYNRFSVNSHRLGFGDPVRVSEGQRVMFRIVNASATTEHRIALPGHRFMVVALDGNPVPNPREVQVLDLGPAERVDAIVTMNTPGVWVLGEVDNQMRRNGLGVVIEYANRIGAAQWTPAPDEIWDYTAFARPRETAPPDAHLVPLVFKKKFAGARWVDNWTINGKQFPNTDPIRVRTGERYRLRLDNRSDEAHPVHLHRHSFEAREHRRQVNRRCAEGRGGPSAHERDRRRFCCRQPRPDSLSLPSAAAHGLWLHDHDRIRMIIAGRP